MKSFNITLSEEDVDYLTYDYGCVEATVAKVLQQAKQQGYIDPDKRSDIESEYIKKTTKGLIKLTNQYIIARLVEFQQKFMDYDIGKPLDRTMSSALNKLFIQKFGVGEINSGMFSFNNCDCMITSSHIAKKLYVQFNMRQKTILNPKEKEVLFKKCNNNKDEITKALNAFHLTHSHNIPFVDFCCQHCNPWIINELEKMLFELL